MTRKSASLSTDASDEVDSGSKEASGYRIPLQTPEQRTAFIEAVRATNARGDTIVASLPDEALDTNAGGSLRRRCRWLIQQQLKVYWSAEHQLRHPERIAAARMLAALFDGIIEVSDKL